MSKFRPNKSKAILNAGTQVLYQKADKIIDTLGVAYPQYAMIFSFVHAGFGMEIAYKQEKLNQFTQYLMNNQDIFSGTKMETREFQEGLLVFLESYFKQRSDEKLKLAQNIFLDFSKTDKLDMSSYPLERYDGTLEKISQGAIQFLGFIHTEIPILSLEYTKSQIHQHGNVVNISRTMDDWHRTYGMSKPVNFYIEEYIKKITIEKMKNYQGNEPLVEEGKIKDELREPFSMASAELEQLGLAKGNERNVGWNGGEYFFNLTHYGKMFTSIIKPEDVYEYIP